MTLLLAALLFAQVPGSIDIDPRLNWYTLETGHFDVHFASRGKPEGAPLALAHEVAAICEEVHATLVPSVGWSPKERTQIVIADCYDFWNGWATPFPANTITVIPTPPAGSLTNDDNWLRTLVLHEYSHILQTDQVAGAARALRGVFGRVILPNALAPAWLNEGFAVYNETRFSDFGRLRSAEYDMIWRAAADSGKLLPVDRCGNYELQRYPGGGAPYIYGSLLHSRVATQLDSGAWDRYNRARSSGLPFLENQHARRTLGKSIYAWWSEAQAPLASHARPMSPAALRPVTTAGFRAGSPLWSRTGNEVYYISETGLEYPSIRATTPSTGETRILRRCAATGNLSLSPDGRLLAFAEYGINDYGQFTDLKTLNPWTGAVRSITHGRRARDPDFAPDTALLVYVANGTAQNDLWLLDLKTDATRPLTENDDHSAYHGPRFSPSGKWIAVGVNRTGGHSDIELVDRDNGWTIAVTRDRANDINPCWSRTGKYLLFSSDRAGTYNLYAYELATAKTFQITNVPYGAFEPSVAPDNRSIAFTNYSAAGFDIAVTGYRAADWTPAADFVDSLPARESPDTAASAELYFYSPFPALWPRFWLPWIEMGDGLAIGAFTLGWDALQFHRYSAVAGYRLSKRTPFLTAGYELRRFRPILGLSVDADLRRQAGYLTASLPFQRTGSGNWFDIGAALARDSALDSRVDFDWQFSNAHRFRFNVAPTEGRAFGLHLDAQSRSLLSAQDRVRALAFAVNYWGRPPASWSLRGKLAAGTAFGDSSAAAAWQLGTEANLLGVRGYGTPSISGRTTLAGGLQFRAPLWWIERGIGTGPVFLQNINGALFADAGLTSPGGIPGSNDLRGTRVGVGAEVRLDAVLVHLLPASLTAGIGVGLNPLASVQMYAGVESSTLAGILARPGRTSYTRHLPEPR